MTNKDLVLDSLADSRNSLRDMRREAKELIEELRLADCHSNDLDMMRESVKILERMAGLVARMSGEAKCAEYLHGTLSNS